MIEPLCAQIAALTARVKEREDRLATKSRHSSPPPSSDSCTTQTRSLCQPSGRKAGGQPGHPGTTLQQVAVPDRTLIHAPEQCVACGASLADVVGQPDPERRHVFDLPPLQWEVTAPRVVRKACARCGHHHRGMFPAGVACGASYGAGVKGVLTSLNQAHLVPSERSGQIVADVCGQPVSEGTLEAAIDLCAAELAETETCIKQGLARAEVANFDETGLYAVCRGQKNVAALGFHVAKVSGGFRTMTGAQAFCRIRSDISTMKKQGHNVIAALKSVFLRTPLVPEMPG